MQIPDDIMTILADLYTLEEINQWMDIPLDGLGGRTPTRAIVDGDADAVREVLRNPADSVFL
jgi:hypothetical protein